MFNNSKQKVIVVYFNGQDMDTLVSEIKYRLSAVGIDALPPCDPGMHPALSAEQKALLLRVVIFGAFYPHYFSHRNERDQEPERAALRSLSGLDPYSTVRLAGFPSGHLHKAYIHQFQQRVQNDIFGTFQISSNDESQKKSYNNRKIMQQ